jgi:hypothetical protein
MSLQLMQDAAAEVENSVFDEGERGRNGLRLKQLLKAEALPMC